MAPVTALELTEALSIKDTTKMRMRDTLNLMKATRNRTQCANLRYELHGMVGALCAENLIAHQTEEALSAALLALWHDLDSAFVVTRKVA